MQVHQKKWSEAVQSLQQAIRGYPTSADLWEVGSLTSEISIMSSYVWSLLLLTPQFSLLLLIGLRSCLSTIKYVHSSY